jgi:secreted trypsin-like serine protease
MSPRVPSRLAVIATTLAAALLAATGPARAIAHGTAVPDGKYGFAVKLTDYGIPVAGGGTRDSSCSGGLISPHWVLTAGHCYHDLNGAHVARVVAARSTATVGRTDLTSSAGQVAKVVGVKQHPTSDVALARLDRAITSVRPMRLPHSQPHIGDSVRLTGFGLTTADGDESPERLRTGKFHISSVTGAEAGMDGTSPDSRTSPCPHDSGGPYFTEAADGTATVVGVVSHGPDCPHSGPDQASRIDVVAAWIQSIIAGDGPSKPTHKPTKPPSHAPSHAPSAAAAPAASEPSPPYWILVPAGVLVAALGLAVLWARTERRRGPHRGRRRASG